MILAIMRMVSCWYMFLSLVHSKLDESASIVELVDTDRLLQESSKTKFPFAHTS